MKEHVVEFEIPLTCGRGTSEQVRRKAKFEIKVFAPTARKALQIGQNRIANSLAALTREEVKQPLSTISVTIDDRAVTILTRQRLGQLLYNVATLRGLADLGGAIGVVEGGVLADDDSVHVRNRSTIRASGGIIRA